MEDITSMLSGMGAIQRVTRETQLPRTSLVPLLVALGRAFSSSAADSGREGVLFPNEKPRLTFV